MPRGRIYRRMHPLKNYKKEKKKGYLLLDQSTKNNWELVEQYSLWMRNCTVILKHWKFKLWWEVHFLSYSDNFLIRRDLTISFGCGSFLLCSYNCMLYVLNKDLIMRFIKSSIVFSYLVSKNHFPNMIACWLVIHFHILNLFVPLLWNQISGIARGQRQIIHQLDNLNNLVRDNLGERSRQVKTTNKRSIIADVEPITVMLTLAVGGLGIFLIKGFLTRAWFLHPIDFYNLANLFFSLLFCNFTFKLKNDSWFNNDG